MQASNPKANADSLISLHISLTEISLILCAALTVSEKALTNKEKHGKDNGEEKCPLDPERYAIFHALFDNLKEKEKKHKKR